MSLSVDLCDNRKTWDARVRVTGSSPQLLWGIGEAETVSHEHTRVERLTVGRDDKTVGYCQILVRPEDLHTVVDAKSLHVKSPCELVGVLDALQEYARDQHGAAVLRFSPDTVATPELVAELEAAGYRRRDKIRKGEAGPRELVVPLGETERDLSRRLSSVTLDRCRAGLKVTGVTVRRVSATTQSLTNVGLRTAHIEQLLCAVGQDSVFLVATEHRDGEQDTALGYLWFVHTGESAMLYRHGFTDRARQLGVDDALLLTGLVQLQQRRVQNVIAGDPDADGQSVVLRELATEQRPVLGAWEFPLVSDYQIAGRAEKTRHRVLGDRSARKKLRFGILPQRPARPEDPAAPVTGSLPVQTAGTALDADPDLAHQTTEPVRGKGAAWASPGAVESEGARSGGVGSGENWADDAGALPGSKKSSGKGRKVPLPRVPVLKLPTPKRARTSVEKSQQFEGDPFDTPEQDEPQTPWGSAGAGPVDARGETGENGSEASSRSAKLRAFARRAVDEGSAAVRDAARW